MENPASPSTMSESFPVSAAYASGEDVSGVWILEKDRLVCIESFDEGPCVLLVRSEDVLMLSVDLPPMANMARRRAALPFAIEDRIADSIEDVHVALGSEVSPNRWLVGVVRHDRMAQWCQQLMDAGLERAAIVPDALTLPVLAEGSWAVDLSAGRAIVRAPDATGFALPLAMLAPAWKAAGEPQCQAYGEPLPPPLHATAAIWEAEPLASRLLNPALDLRQGQYAAPRRKLPVLWKRVALIIGLGAAAHGGIAVADTLALERIAERRNAEVRELATKLQPSFVLGDDLAATIAEMTPDAAANAPSPFLTLLSRTSGALAAAPAIGTWRSVTFDRAAATLTITVETSDISGLQQVVQELTKAGLTAQPGSASSDQGIAVGTFTVRPS